jgi:hypothetical protein
MPIACNLVQQSCATNPAVHTSLQSAELKFQQPSQLPTDCLPLRQPCSVPQPSKAPGAAGTWSCLHLAVGCQAGPGPSHRPTISDTCQPVGTQLNMAAQLPHNMTAPQQLTSNRHPLAAALNKQVTLHPSQHSTAQHSTAQHSTAQHSTAQHSTAQHAAATAAQCWPHSGSTSGHQQWRSNTPHPATTASPCSSQS